MPESLFHRLEELRRQLRRVLMVYGLCWLVVGIVGVVVVAGLADWAFHVSGGLRLIFLIGISLWAIWLIHRRLVVPLNERIRDLDLALRLERYYPQLGERLSSTVDFLLSSEDDPFAGSRQLRDRVVQETLSQTREVSFKSIVESQPARRMGAWSASVLAVALALILASPSGASIALRRLANPFGGPDWPLRTHVKILNPRDKVAKGDPFSLDVEIVGDIPRRVTVRYRFADGEQTAAEPLRPVDETTFKGGLDAVNRPFEFSITAGDAITEWKPVDVVPAPEVTNLQLALAFPEYTRLEPDLYPEGRGHVRAVVGAKVALSAVSNKPLRRAELHWEKGGSTPASVSENGTRVAAEFTVQADDTYRIILHDFEEMTNAERAPKRYRVQALPDKKPEVALQRPLGDREVTANATIPIRALVKDDFGIAGIELRYLSSADAQPAKEGEQTEPRQKSVPLTATDLGAEPDSDNGLRLRALAEHAWSLEPLQLSHGSVVTLHVAARDFRDVPEPNIGKSREVRLRIVTRDEFLAQFENEQQRVREELERILKLQQNAQTQVADLQKEAEIVGELGKKEVEKLQSAEMTQRRIDEKITDADHGLQNRIDEMLQNLDNNRVENVETSKRLRMIRSELGRISEQHLPPITQSLTNARKQAKAQQARAKDPASKDSQGKGAERKQQVKQTARNLERAAEHQQQVADSLAQMLEQLDKWDSVAQLTNDARELERRQASAAEQVQKLADKTLGKSEQELTAEERAALEKAASRQSTNRDQQLFLERKMRRVAENRKQDKDEATADLLDDALKQVQEQNLSGKMAQAAENVRRNRTNDASRLQQQVAEGLRQLIETLENRREQELLRLIKQMRLAEKDIQKLLEQQEQIREQTDQAKNMSDQQKRRDELMRLQKRQRQLQQQTQQLARRLSRLRAENASRRSGRAADRMRQAGQQLQQGQPQDAGEKQKQAQQELEEAQRQLAQARRQAEAELAQEQLAKISDAIRQIHERQLGVKDELARLENLRTEKGRWSRGQLQSLSSLARAQRGLADESKLLTDKLEYAKAFVLVIDRAIAKMNEVVGLVQERSAGEPTQRAATDAAARFAMLLDALRRDPNQQQNEQKQNGGQQGGQGGQGGGGGDGIPDRAQIKLIKALQTDIYQRTVELVEAREEEGKWTPAQEREMGTLGEQQGELADLIRDLTQPADDTE